MDNFEQVSTDIIKAISELHYEDKEKELIKLQIQYVLCKMTMTQKQFEEDIKVLDMPLLDTRIEGKNLVGKFISDIVLQVLSFVAENERNNIKERQAEGIRIAKEKGVRFGRPRATTPPNTNEILDKYINHKITNIEAASIIGVSRGTFFRLVKDRSLANKK